MIKRSDAGGLDHVSVPDPIGTDPSQAFGKLFRRELKVFGDGLESTDPGAATEQMRHAIGSARIVRAFEDGPKPKFPAAGSGDDEPGIRGQSGDMATLPSNQPPKIAVPLIRTVPRNGKQRRPM